MFKKKLGVLILAILIFGIPKTSFAESEFNSFQQIMNYIVTGNSSQNQKTDKYTDIRKDVITTIRKVKIFDKEKCIAGWEETTKKYDNYRNKYDERGSSIELMKINWNSIHVGGLEIKDLHGDKILNLWGEPSTKVTSIKAWPRTWEWETTRRRGGRLTLGNNKEYNDEHLKKALKTLFSKYCREPKRRAIAKAKIKAQKAKVRAKNKNDLFQQVVNYLVTGDPLNGRAETHEAKIFNRKKCIAGWEDDEGGYLKIYWNNIDVKSMKIQDKLNKGEWRKYISFSGHPLVMDFKTQNRILTIFYLVQGLLRGTYTSVSLPLGKQETFDDERLIKALQLLYSKHCTGSKRKSAF